MNQTAHIAICVVICQSLHLVVALTRRSNKYFWIGHVRDVTEAAIYRLGVMWKRLLQDISVNIYVWAFLKSQPYWSLCCNSRHLGRLAVVASRRTRWPMDNYVIWGLLGYVWPNTSGRTTPARSARKFPQRQAHHGECHNNVYDTKYTSARRSPLSRLPVLGRDQGAFHRPNAMLAPRCASVVSCDLIFTPNLIGLLDTPLAHLLAIAFLFHSPIMCTVVGFFWESVHVAILAAY